WLIALTTKFSFDLLWARVEELCPRWHDPLELKEVKLQALLYCFKLSGGTLPKNLLIVLESLSEFKYCHRPVGAHAVVFRFLLRVLTDFPSEMDRLEVPQELCDMLRSCLGVLPSVLALNQRVKSQAVQYKLLHSLGSFVSCLEPPSRIQRYFGLLVILSEISWLDPSYVLTALHRLVFSPSSLSWEAGMRVLITCRRMILSHPQAVIYQPMLRLLQHLATYQSDVDLRDRALLYLRLLSHSGPAALGALFNPHPGNMQRMTQMLSPVLPLTVRLVNGPVPFLRLVKSPQERKRLGLLDRQTAVFVLPGEELTSDWEKRWGDAGVDHQFPKEWHQDFAETDSEGLDVLLREYRKLLQASPSSIRLPFVLLERREMVIGMDG
ncbi:Hypothetical protein SCF082_LOCUS52089, partial [Durusdinium trenchii]